MHKLLENTSVVRLLLTIAFVFATGIGSARADTYDIDISEFSTPMKDCISRIQQASDKGTQDAVGVANGVHEQASPMDFWKLYCFQNDLDLLDFSAKTMGSYLGNVIYGVLANIVEQYSQYVCSWAQFYVSEVTSKLCIPIPQFNYNLNLQNKLAKRCGGNTVALVKIPTGVGMLTTQDIYTYFNSMKMNQ